MEMLTADSILTETQMQQSILGAARDLGWLAYATHRSDKSEPGFPDLVLVRPPRVIFAELKIVDGRIRKGRWNKTRTRWLPGQDDWGKALGDCPGVEYYLVWPADLQEFMERLR